MEIAVANQNEPKLGEVLRKAFNTVRRRWKMLAIVTAIVFALGTLLTFMMTPQYFASARVRIDPSRDPVAAQNGTVNAALSDEAIETEVSAFYSMDLARAVVRDLDLSDVPQFQEAIADLPPESIASPEERETAIASYLLDNLGVFRENQTYVLGVGYENADRIKAAEIANSFAENYIKGAVGTRTSVAASQAEWYQEQLAELGSQVTAADAAAARFRIENRLSQGQNDGFSAGTIIDQQVAPLSGILAEAESFAAQARANYQTARSQVGRPGASVSEVLQSQTISNLRVQRGAILDTKADIEARYGAMHPESIKIQEQLRGVDQELNQETNRILTALSATASAADARVVSLRNSLGQLETDRASQTRAGVIADSLDREAQAKRALYEQLTEESLKATQAASNSLASATIVDMARPPERPSKPNKPLFMIFALVAGLGIGIGFIAIQESLSSGIRTSEDVEDRLGVPLLSAVPQVAGNTPADTLVTHPTSFYAEAFRIARTSLLGTADNRSTVSVIAITSALPGEGKTTTSVAFARTLAMAGSRTLLLECDIRRATVQLASGVSPGSKGLVEYLTADATVDETIVASGTEGLDLLMVRSPYFSSANLFENEKMGQLINLMRERYDHIVLDLPPILGLADGRTLAAFSDAVAVVARWDETPIPVVQKALEALEASGHEASGIIVNAVAESSELLGGGYYLRRYSQYYQ